MASSTLAETTRLKLFYQRFVKCFPLSWILEALNVTKVDLLSLDVNGPELEVLQNIPWHELNITVRIS